MARSRVVARASSLALFAVVVVVASSAPRGVSADDPAPADAWTEAQRRGYLRWGADAEGGAPYVFADPKDPATPIGFEVDIANALGEELKLDVRFEQREWASLYQDAARGAIDFGMNGLEVNEENKKLALFTRPYYVFSEQLVVRATEDRVKTVADMKDRPAGTLEATVAERLLKEAGADVHSYKGQVEPFDDLEVGRVDGVLLDGPIVRYYAEPAVRPAVRWTGEPIRGGEYALAVAPGQQALRAKLDEALGRLVRSGKLSRILRSWRLWDDRQWSLVTPAEAGDMGGLFDLSRARAEVGQVEASVPAAVEPLTGDGPMAWLGRHGPLLLQAALMTIQLSVLSMALAIGLGIPLAIARVYSGPILSALAGIYVEIFRGTPIMLQLFVIYYGLPHIGIEFPPLVAAILGLGMNYAAYEAEIYRAGLQAIPRGQMEAGLALGLTRAQAIRRIILPQAVRLVIPPVTNDFVALLKDTSIVSVIAIQELTKRFYISGRSDVSHFVHLAVATAVLYLLMSYPLSLWSRRMEKKLAGEA